MVNIITVGCSSSTTEQSGKFVESYSFRHFATFCFPEFHERSAPTDALLIRTKQDIVCWLGVCVRVCVCMMLLLAQGLTRFHWNH